MKYCAIIIWTDILLRKNRKTLLVKQMKYWVTTSRERFIARKKVGQPLYLLTNHLEYYANIRELDISGTKTNSI